MQVSWALGKLTPILGMLMLYDKKRKDEARKYKTYSQET
jgi:hypothetical protein